MLFYLTYYKNFSTAVSWFLKIVIKDSVDAEPKIDESNFKVFDKPYKRYYISDYH